MLTMQQVDRRSKKKAETLRRIERTALRTFRDRGYDATSTRQIADDADIAVGTLFNYFPEKRALLVHLMQGRLNAALANAQATMPRHGMVEQLDHLFDVLEACYAEERRIARAFVKEFLFVEGALREETATWTYGMVQAIARIVEDAQTDGEIDPNASSTRVAQHIFGLHYFGLVTWLGGTVPSVSAQRTQLRSAVELVARGLRRENWSAVRKTA